MHRGQQNDRLGRAPGSVAIFLSEPTARVTPQLAKASIASTVMFRSPTLGSEGEIAERMSAGTQFPALDNRI
jgi:hypothetical protein